MNHYLTNRKKITTKNNIAIFSKEWLSNFEKSDFVINNQTFHSVEQYMHAEKAKTFNDITSYNKIIKSDSPKECLELGRLVQNYSEDKWSKIRYKVVYDGTKNKYIQNYELLEALLSFGKDVEFVEASETDFVWACGLSKTDENIFDKSKWKGLNLLGKVITNVKNDLINQNYLSTIKSPNFDSYQALIKKSLPPYYSGTSFNEIATFHFRCGKPHREDGPAIEYANGDKIWYLNGKFHREGGPAIEDADGYKIWRVNNQVHREDGPAIEWANGNKEWYLNNTRYGYNNDFTNESWIRFVKIQLLK